MRLPGSGRVRALGRAVVGAVRRRSPRGLVLLYHRVAGPRLDPLLLDVSPANFDAQLAVLCSAATVLPLEEFESLRRAGRLPEHAVAVTFDDGYADNLHAAAPLLAQHGVPATVFVTSGMIGAEGEFWWDDVERVVWSAVPLAAPVPIPGIAWTGDDAARPALTGWSAAEAHDPTPRHRLYRQLLGAIQPLAVPARDAAMAALRRWAGVANAGRDTHRTMTAAELRTLASEPLITIGAHSVSHPILSLHAAADQLRELLESRTALTQLLGRDVTSVAYPFGTGADVSDVTVRAARDAGYAFALANEPAPAWRWSDRWRIPRVLVRDWDGDEFAQRLHHWLSDD